jgi:signal transduction histidine kinase/ligand-binding sensor domain-containing protein
LGDAHLLLFRNHKDVVKSARLIIAAVLFLAVRVACGQSQTQPFAGSYSVTTWTPGNGAPTVVTSLAQTADGTLWIGTDSGLFQFDGVQFRRYGEGRFTTSLTAPATGGLWIGFQLGGAAFLKDGRLTTYPTGQGLPEASVRQIVVDQDGAVWVATTAGLLRLANGRWEPIGAGWGLPEGDATTLLGTRAGVLWTHVGEEIFFKRPGEHTFTRAETGDTYGDVVEGGLVEGPDGTVWAIGIARGLRGVTHATTPFVPWARGDDYDFPLIGFGPDGVLWIFTRNKQYRIANPEVLEARAGLAQLHYEEFGATVFDNAYLSLQDREGNLWVGTAGGLSRLTRSSFHIVENERTSEFALSASPDGSMVWTEIYPEGRRITHYQNGRIDWRMPIAAWMGAAHRDNEGTVWFGSREGLWRLTGRSMSLTPYPKSVSGLETQAVLRDRDGDLWSSIRRQGVFRYAAGQWQKNGGLAGLPPDTAIAMANDAAGRIWLAYAGARVGMVDGNTARTFGIADGLPDSNMTAIGTRGDHVWVGSESGLHWFDGTRFSALHVRNESALSGLWGIVETSHGDLWTAGIAGVAHFTATQLARAKASGGRLDETVQVLSTAEGMPGSVQSMRPTPALVESGDGKLWLSFTGNVGYIDTNNLVRNPVPPPVQIRSLLAAGREYLPQSAPIELPQGTTQLRIPYTAYSFVAPDRVRFKYRLEGVENEWQDAGDRREATYTNIAPGKYRFQVIAANNDGVWNETGAALGFVVLPAFYQTTWFYILCFLAGAILLVLLYRLRMHQVTSAVRLRLEERIVERERIARELHDTLLQGLQGLILRFQAGTNRVSPQDPGRKVLESALERADQVLIEGRNRVKGLRASAQMQGDLPAALEKVGEQLALDSDVRFSLAIEGTPLSVHPILKEEIFLIVREALTNAFRHSCASSVEAEITYSQAELRLRIRDNGRGIPETVLAQGVPGHWGLAGMRERAQRIRGQLEIWTRDGAGTEVQLRVGGSLAYREPGNRDVGELVT